MPLCPTCGSDVAEGAQFCPDCGTDMTAAPAPAGGAPAAGAAAGGMDSAGAPAAPGAMSAVDLSAEAPAAPSPAPSSPDAAPAAPPAGAAGMSPEAPPVPPVPPSAPAPPAPAVAGARLTLKRGGALSSESFPVSGRVVVGRFDIESGPVDVDLGSLPESTYVSRHHAEIWQDAGGQWMVKDLGSRNGTFVRSAGQGGFRKAEGDQPIQDGDEIALGNARFEFRTA